MIHYDPTFGSINQPQLHLQQQMKSPTCLVKIFKHGEEALCNTPTRSLHPQSS
jgi:hypothetical protein